MKSDPNRFLAPVLPDLDAVNAVIREQMHSDIVLIGRIADYIINAGGKRIRPILLLLMAKALGYQGRQHQTLAAVVEFIHTATLLHDDVVDEAGLRRGLPSANALFGNAASVLVGDFLYTRAFQMMVSVNSMPVQQVLADATNLIAEGEVMQLMNARSTDLDEAGYRRVIYAKTAKLFEAACQLGAMTAGASAQQTASAIAYGRALGNAFQLIDDLLDYASDADTMGKQAGNDLKEGKMTLPLIWLMENGGEAQKTAIRRSIEENDESCFETVFDAVRSSGALDYTYQMAKQEAEVAVKAIAELPDSQYRQSLIELSLFSVERDY
ncbi:MAG: polyprenyl synthetase family protein [Oxalobacter sp.]|nr:polyprenyl synthetase family protein [Oxalobacter sp.]